MTLKEFAYCLGCKAIWKIQYFSFYWYGVIIHLPEEKRTLASEIIADQQKEIEKLKTDENIRDNMFQVLSRQTDIISYILKLESIESLNMIFGSVRTAYEFQLKKEQEQEEEN